MLKALGQLGTTRAIGMGGMGPIPWTAAAEWCKINRVTGPAAAHLIDIVMILDAKHRELVATRSDQTHGK